MSADLLRAYQLLGLRRPSDAAEAARRHLAQAPEDAQGHIALATCLVMGDQPEEGLAEAERAVALAPDDAEAHTARARALLALQRSREAEDAAQRVLELEPGDADGWALLAACRSQRDDAASALEACERGLAIDAEHAGCMDLRVHLLSRLGRRDEAREAAQSALARDPEDADAHANLGFELLHRGDADGAITHFAEALRREPDQEFAREGMVTALKARRRAYRWAFTIGMALSRLPPVWRWAVVIAAFALLRIVDRIADVHPAATPWLRPITWAVCALACWTWLADPVLDLLLACDRRARYALDDHRRRAAWAAGSMLAVAVGSVAAYLLGGPALCWLLALVALMLAPMLHESLGERVARRRRILIGVAAGVVLLCALSLVLIAVEHDAARRVFLAAVIAWGLLSFTPELLRARGW